jgi:hypothetical protein
LAAAALLGLALGAHPAWLGGTLLLGGGLLAVAVGLYRVRGPAALRPMAGLIEAAALLTALGWLAAATL